MTLEVEKATNIKHRELPVWFGFFFLQKIYGQSLTFKRERRTAKMATGHPQEIRLQTTKQ